MSTKDKLPDPYVRFYMQNGVEIATCLAMDFRDAMNGRDTEIAELRAENETLKRALTFAEGEVAGMADERLQRENRDLRAENQQLRTGTIAATLDRAWDDVIAERDALRAEVMRNKARNVYQR